MKEYKVMMPKLGITKRVEKLEEILNQLSREGWEYKEYTYGVLLVMKRNKNR